MLTQMNLTQFLEALASNAPAPGGGSAAAQFGATGAALLSMVCQLTVGKEKFKAVEPDMMKHLEDLECLRRALTALIDRDTEAFNKVSAAYKLPKEDKETRSKAIAEAMRHAAEIPLETAKLCLSVMQHADDVLAKGNPNALSDCGVGVSGAFAGFNGAVMNVMINLPSIKDEAFVRDTAKQIETMRRESKEIYERVLNSVFQTLKK